MLSNFMFASSWEVRDCKRPHLEWPHCSLLGVLLHHSVASHTLQYYCLMSQRWLRLLVWACFRIHHLLFPSHFHQNLTPQNYLLPSQLCALELTALSPASFLSSLSSWDASWPVCCLLTSAVPADCHHFFAWCPVSASWPSAWPRCPVSGCGHLTHLPVWAHQASWNSGLCLSSKPASV